MKIALASDIHLEFGNITITNEQQADVLILSGDICTAKVFKHKPKERAMVRQFFSDCAFMFKHVIYVMGNHEHYDYDIAHTYNLLKFELSPLVNVHLLEKESITIDDVTFVGGTLWTNMNKGDPLTMWHCGQRMSDFKLIKNSNRSVTHKNVVYVKNPDGSGLHLKNADGSFVVERVDFYEKPSRWSVEDSVVDHDKMLSYINLATEDKDKKYVVVTHHAPSSLSISEQYKGDMLNGAFRSDLDEFIESRPQIKLWTHGHMHNNSNYWIGDTRVVCNPRGYVGYESCANFFQLKYLEV
jgi:Icc-related predicted phosphoesterase